MVVVGIGTVKVKDDIAASVWQKTPFLSASLTNWLDA